MSRHRSSSASQDSRAKRDDLNSIHWRVSLDSQVLGDDPRKRPLTVGEVTANWGDELLKVTSYKLQATSYKL